MCNHSRSHGKQHASTRSAFGAASSSTKLLSERSSTRWRPSRRAAKSQTSPANHRVAEGVTKQRHIPNSSSQGLSNLALCCKHKKVRNGPTAVSESTVSNTELSEFFGARRVPGRELSEFLSAYYLCAKANSQIFFAELTEFAKGLAEFSLPKQYLFRP